MCTSAAANIFSVNTAAAQSGNNAAPFVDISNSFAKQQIMDLYRNNIISGTSGRKFEPKKPVTRAEFMAMAIRILRLKPTANDLPSYTDVARNSWYYGDVQAASDLKLAYGKDSGKFRPLGRITRQETAVMIMRMLKQQDVGQTWRSVSYKDNGDIALWAAADVRKISTLGLMNGNAGNFRPKDSITRQEMAAVLDRILHNPRWSAELKKSPSAGIQLGWQYGSTTAQFIKQVSNSSINTLSPRYHYLQKDGSVSDSTDPALISWASSHGRKVWSMLGNRSNAELTHTILANDQKRSWVIKQLIGYVKKYRLHGINVDFENVQASDRSNLTAFIDELAAELHGVNAKLSVNVSPDLGTSWTAAFDYRALGDRADYIILMGYDEHWAGAPTAGSVSSLPWLEKAAEKLVAYVPRKKIILALPFYSREWIKDTGAYSGDITLVRQGEIARNFNAVKEWNSGMGQYVLEYGKQGVNHRIWAEESRSLSLKAAMAADRGITGFAYWYPGAETKDVWTSLKNAVRYASYKFS
ncbi:glycoside hydrolase [Cohnella kolymensis]|uniref:Glycoside hydrolase n=2 Tax=Cohnella kolymensis TaxID=1590652 RepID=A0ABR4ZZZ6_9BACL|nr:glycoside hydrolase [Cohnella kolymensis]